MFLGLRLLFLILISPFIIGMFLYGLKKKSEFLGKTILTIYAIGTGYIVIMSIISILLKKIVLEKSDFYGEYTIDRNYFSGKQADWQYNSFRFEIKKNDSIYFHVTNGEKINETYKGIISTPAPYKSARLNLRINEPNHHVLKTNPTIYRESWSFFMVFESEKYNNMYFRKTEWKPIEKK